MLIEFSVENFMSIKNAARLSLVVGPGKEHRETHVMAPELNRGVRPTPLLRSTAIYGANAAGKTNLLLALWTMRQIVVHSARELGELPTTPFRFDAESEARPTTFEVIGIVNRMRFQYGFSATRDIVTEEWLYAWPHGRIQVWFERTSDTEDGIVNCKFGDKLTGDKEVWRRATRPKALLLSTAVTLNSEQLQPVFNWFNRNLHISELGSWGNDFSVKWCRGDRKTDVVRFLRAADLAIDDVRIVLGESSEQGIADAEAQIRLTHDTKHGRTVELDLGEESHGTQKMFALAAPWRDSLDNGHVMVCDELHGFLHPALVRFLVEQFHDPDLNAKGAQLVFTTHETSILNQEILRRDQIWFCERNSRQETNLFPLTDFRPRRGVENLERSYLGGRYGALPYIRPTRIRSDV